MSDELYESLIEIYKSFLLEKESLLEKIELCDNSNDNEYQIYNKYLYIIDSRINTLSALLKLFEGYLLSKKAISSNESASNNEEKTIDLKGSFGKEVINKHLQILDIQEKERHRIARDLHDTSLQNLTHLTHKIELSSLYIDKDPIRAKLELEIVNKKLRSVIQEIRNTIFDLHPMTFDDLGMKESFERLIEKLSETSKISIDYNIENINCNNSLILMTIFRIVEECLNNAIKHSKGTRIFFEIRKNDDDNCLIVVSDNGISFDSKDILFSKDNHFGLSILKERVELLLGSMEIDSKPDHGTTIKIIVPLLD